MDAIYWDPDREIVNLDLLEGFDAIVHLAGENIAARWTTLKKTKILLSREHSTLFLSNSIVHLENPPKVFFSMSATGYYGDCGAVLVTEKSQQGSGFLSDVCAKWEAASQILEKRGIRVVRARCGVVLSFKGGVLPKLLSFARFGLIGRVGEGKQWMSWISLEDLLSAIEFAIQSLAISGVLNFTAPFPITNKDFACALAKFSHKKWIIPIPAWAVSFFCGDMGKEVFLFSTKAFPEKLLLSGFCFHNTSIDDVLSISI